MYEKKLKQMAEMSQIVGKYPDLVQGGGGNTSVKLDDHLMAVKASGCKLKDMTEKEGFVVIDYMKIREYYDKVDLNHKIDYYEDSTRFVKENTVHLPGLQEGMRASVEAGFHSLLLDYVIHAHSVYGNILTCTGEGKRIAEAMFGTCKYGFMWLPYIAPGFELTLGFKKRLDHFKAGNGSIPKIIFMESHGMVVTSDDYHECLEINDYVNGVIKDKFNIRDSYGYVGIEEIGENEYISRSDILKEYFKGTTSYMDANWFSDHILYPDQGVYLMGNISNDDNKPNKININLENGDIIYKTNYKEALTMEESIAAFIYILEKSRLNQLTVMTMQQEDVDFITNVEGVKYRKTLLK
ncbi:MAG: class II aldolase/adducin family protein [Clostridia bacterium]|nr:class II aldolase/adducin family protein [Clostridia bacterium]